MNANDATLQVLLRGVKDAAQRETIIAAHTTLHAGGASTLPGALAILLARLVDIVVGLAAAMVPANHDVALLREEIANMRAKDLPLITQAKEEIIRTSRSTRRLRMTYVYLWILLATALSAGASGFAVYYFTALTPQQQNWLSIGKHQGRALKQTEIDWLKVAKAMSRQGIYFRPVPSEPGTFGYVLGGDDRWISGTYVEGSDGHPRGVEIHWPENGDGQ
jgi:hypothetical protein